MRELLRAYADALEWAGGVGKDDTLAHLAGRNETLRTEVDEYVLEGAYPDPDSFFARLPVQAWREGERLAWRGAKRLLPEDVDAGFGRGLVGERSVRGDASNAPLWSPSSEPETAFCGAAFGTAGGNSGEVDPNPRVGRDDLFDASNG